MFAEDLATFFDVDGGFASPATVNGVACAVIYERDALVAEGQLMAEHSALLPATVAAAEGHAVVVQGGAGAGSYRVRQVLPEPPDGAVRRLVLAKV